MGNFVIFALFAVTVFAQEPITKVNGVAIGDGEKVACKSVVSGKEYTWPNYCSLWFPKPAEPKKSLFKRIFGGLTETGTKYRNPNAPANSVWGGIMPQGTNLASACEGLQADEVCVCNLNNHLAKPIKWQCEWTIFKKNKGPNGRH